MYCRQCNKEIPENSKFCNECGSAVIKTETTQSTNDKQMDDFFLNIIDLTKTELNTNTKTEETFKASDSEECKMEEVAMPKLSGAFWFCIVVTFFIGGIIMYLISIGASHYFEEVEGFLWIAAFLFFAFLSFTIMSVFISDYKLAKKDFARYARKVQKQKKFEEEYEKKRKKQEEELNAKREEYRAKGIPTCPNCGSTAIATINRGYSFVTGFIGSGKPVNVCQICGYKWQIGKEYANR